MNFRFRTIASDLSTSICGDCDISLFYCLFNVSRLCCLCLCYSFLLTRSCCANLFLNCDVGVFNKSELVCVFSEKWPFRTVERPSQEIIREQSHRSIFRRPNFGRRRRRTGVRRRGDDDDDDGDDDASITRAKTTRTNRALKVKHIDHW